MRKVLLDSGLRLVLAAVACAIGLYAIYHWQQGARKTLFRPVGAASVGAPVGAKN